MQFMHHQQSQGLDFDHPLRSYMLQAYARIGRCLGREFSQYLHMIMPSLLASASVTAEVVTVSGKLFTKRRRACIAYMESTVD